MLRRLTSSVHAAMSQSTISTEFAMTPYRRLAAVKAAIQRFERAFGFADTLGFRSNFGQQRKDRMARCRDANNA
jgi:hypothetical protein